MLTKRNYIGEGTIREYINNDTLLPFYVICPDEDSHNIPEIEGAMFIQSNSGVVIVDTPNHELGLNEYCEYKDGYFAVISQDGVNFVGELSLNKIVNNKYIK